ncbi:tetratricopeptide repeat protein [Listeria newyorkensis]|uniref:Tetratricopeptide repeat protein n=1 Tax=Listeria newyorkensis TaxID=1497681 RepID=A0A841YTS3_9LIST|nr:tetratricopeptide repeat protein [Listeria newyorkensis]MBC1456800.1 hypothetical protein [Listeria newyorkensis]
MISTRIMKFEAFMKLVDQGEMTEAREAAAAYVEAQPRGFLGYLCWTYVTYVGDGDMDLANGYLEETLRWDPRCEEAIHLGVLIWTGRDDAKEKYFIEQGMRYVSREPFYPYRMGLLLEKKDLKEATVYFEKAAVLGSRNAEYVGKYATVMYSLGKKKIAREYMKRALGIDPNHTENVRRFAQMSYEAGDFKAAREFSERALEMTPNELEAQALVRQAYPTGNGLVAFVRKFCLFFARLFRGTMTDAKINAGFLLGFGILYVPLFFVNSTWGIACFAGVLIVVALARLIADVRLANRKIGRFEPGPVPVIAKTPVPKAATEPAKKNVAPREVKKHREVNPPLTRKAVNSKRLNPKIIIVPAAILLGFGMISSAIDSNNGLVDGESFMEGDAFADSESISSFLAIQEGYYEDADEETRTNALDYVDESYRPTFEKLMGTEALKDEFMLGMTDYYFDDQEFQYVKIMNEAGDLLFLAEFQEEQLHYLYGDNWNQTAEDKARYQALLQVTEEEYTDDDTEDYYIEEDDAILDDEYIEE